MLRNRQHLIRLLYMLFALYLANSLFLHIRGVFYHDDPNDISAFYTAATFKHAGIHKIYDSAALNRLAAEEGITCGVNHYLYSPFWAEVLSPFTVLSFQQFRLLWLVLNHLLFFLLLVVTVRIVSRDQDPHSKLVVTITAIMTFMLLSAFERDFHYGQVNVFLAVLIYSAVLMAGDRHYVFPGMFVAFCAMLKLGPILLLAYFWLTKKYKALFASAGFVLGFTFLSVALFGITDWVIFFRDILPSFAVQLYPSDVAKTVTLETTNYSFVNFLYFLLLGFGSTVSGITLSLVHKLFGLTLILSYGMLLWRRRNNLRSPMIVMQIILTVMLFLSPIVWHAHLLFIAPGFVFAGYAMIRGKLERTEILLLILRSYSLPLPVYKPVGQERI